MPELIYSWRLVVVFLAVYCLFRLATFQEEKKKERESGKKRKKRQENKEKLKEKRERIYIHFFFSCPCIHLRSQKFLCTVHIVPVDLFLPLQIN